MCGRYQFTEDAPELREITARLRAEGADAFKIGEVFPTNGAPVLLAEDGVLRPAVQNWGFPAYGRSGVVINARAETAHEKRMFQNSLICRRCAVPTAGFFEWTHAAGEKRKYLFRKPGESALYLAGLWGEFGGERRFVILTRAANDSMRGIHDRMPVILARDELQRWATDNGATFALLRREGPALSHTEAV